MIEEKVEFSRVVLLYSRNSPKRRFLTEKYQIPKVVSEKKAEKTIYFTPKSQDQIFISTPHLKTPLGKFQSSTFTENIRNSGKNNYSTLPQKEMFVESVASDSIGFNGSQRTLESVKSSKEPKKVQILDSVQKFDLDARDHVVKETLKNSPQEMNVDEAGKNNKRSFNEEEVKQVKKSRKEAKYKTPKMGKLSSLKRKSTFTVLDKEIYQELLPEKGWITPMSRRLGRKASRSVQVTQKSSVMCQTMPLQQESKRIKVTPSIERIMLKAPASISKPVLQGNELDEKTVQVLLNAAKENGGISESSMKASTEVAESSQALKTAPSEFKVPLPLAKENISPSSKEVEESSSVSTGSTSLPAPELPKFSFNIPASTSTAVGSNAVLSQKPAFSFSLPGATTPVLSTVPQSESTSAAPKFSFGIPAPTSTATTASVSTPSFVVPASNPATGASTTTTTTMPTFSFAPAATSATVTATATIESSSAGKSATTSGLSFTLPSSTSATPPPSTTATSTPISFSFGANNQGTSTPAASNVENKDVSAAPSIAPVFTFGAPSSSVSGSTPSTSATNAHVASFSFGKASSTPAAASTFSFGAATAPSTSVASSGGSALPAPTTQTSTAPVTPFGQFSQPSPSTTAPPFGNVQDSTSKSLFGQPAPASTPFGQVAPSVSTPFGQANPSSATPFGQTPSASSPFGQVTQSTVTPVVQTPASSSAFGQSLPQAAASGFGQSTAPTSTSAFGQSSAPVSTAFGQSTAPASTSAFGQAAPASTPFGQAGSAPFGQTSASSAPPTFGQTPASFGAGTPFGASNVSAGFGQTASTSSSGFSQPAATPAPFGQQSGNSSNTGFGTASGQATGFGQPGTGFSSSFGQSAPSASFATTPAPFGNTGTSNNNSQFGFSNPPAQFGAQGSSSNPPFNAPQSGSSFTFGQPQSSASAFSFGVQSPGGAPASPGFSFNAAGAPQMPQMPSGPGFSLGSGGDTTRKLAQPKGRLRKAGLRR